MYGDLARYWPLLSPVEDYEETAAVYTRLLREEAPGARTLLELGSGGGHHAFWMKRDLELSLVDLSPAMLDRSRALNPELEHHQGDMRSLRLERRFDAVFIHDAISYMRTRAELLAALESAAAHLEPGGVLLVAPDETRESFEPGTECGGADEGALGFRYLEWTYDPDPEDEELVAEYAFLIRHEDGRVEVAHEQHQHGLFPRAAWLELMEQAGFGARLVRYPIEGYGEYDLFVGLRR